MARVAATNWCSFPIVVAALCLGMTVSADDRGLIQSADPRNAASAYAEIQVLDATTGRGVPLVELETVDSQRFVTDNAGRVAFHEPGLLGREVFFTVRSHGYEMRKDGFGFSGTRVTPRPGVPAVIKITRKNLAERLCRLTGEGLYRDSILLGYKPPRGDSPHPGRVAGQDSIQAAVYRNRVYWFWGDTSRMEYPLGLFRVAGATTSVPDATESASDPAYGIAYDYFVDQTGFARAMMPLPERPDGVVWITAVCVVPDEEGREKLVGHYTRRRGLAVELEQGIAVFNDERQVFESARQLPLSETWRRPSGHPIAWEEGDQKWVLFGSPTPNVRVPARLRDVLEPTRYESFTSARGARDGKPTEPLLDADGQPRWRWQRELPPVDSKTEREWIKNRKLRPQHARFCPVNAADAEERIVLHSGTVRWNAFRQRWVLVASQVMGKASMLGEVWYAEADQPTGPFVQAVQIVTHDKQSFYNVCHHDFLDRDGGRRIHFEGTYTNEFSGNPYRTPRYNYNQVLYRLDLETLGLRTP